METPKAYSYIRFSTPEQIKGDSLRRQLEMSERYARENKLLLDNSLNLRDLGLSAYHGTHRTKGALGMFLRLVNEGKIAKGSVLLVESLDRLSRQNVDDAFDQFRGLIKAGITIITLSDGMKYDKDTMNQNWTQLIVSITIMARANEESKRKSERLKSAWKNKREMAFKGEKKMTARIPLWLELSEDKKSFKVIKERARVIELIFQMRLEGKGRERIVKELNQTDLWKPQGKRNPYPSWKPSYIEKILNNPAVIGEIYPHKLIHGKRVKDGEPIIDYYPAIIEKEVYEKVNRLIKGNAGRKGNAGGRIGKAGNLFSHLLICGHCQGKMVYMDKGIGGGGKYLRCSRAKYNSGCDALSIKYELVEDGILNYCVGLDPSSIIPQSSKRLIQINNLHTKVESLEHEKEAITSKMDSLILNIEEVKTKSFVQAVGMRHSALKAQQEKIEIEIPKLRAKIQELSASSDIAETQLRSIKELKEKMENSPEEKSITIRLNLRNQLSHLIDRIRVFSDEKKVALFFKTKQRRAFNLIGEPEIQDAFPKKYFPNRKKTQA